MQLGPLRIQLDVMQSLHLTAKIVQSFQLNGKPAKPRGSRIGRLAQARVSEEILGHDQHRGTGLIAQGNGQDPHGRN